MNENYKIVSKFIKDISGETPDVETYLYVKDYISKYQMNIEINSKALKAQIIEINTLLKFHDNSESKKKSHFELTYTTIIKLEKEIKEKKVLQKIILCDVQNDIYPELEKSFLKTHPQFEKHWDYQKNYPLRPEHFTYGSMRDVWWKCGRGHSYKRPIQSKSLRNFRCPICYC